LPPDSGGLRPPATFCQSFGLESGIPQSVPADFHSTPTISETKAPRAGVLTSDIHPSHPPRITRSPFSVIYARSQRSLFVTRIGGKYVGCKLLVGQPDMMPPVFVSRIFVVLPVCQAFLGIFGLRLREAQDSRWAQAVRENRSGSRRQPLQRTEFGGEPKDGGCLPLGDPCDGAGKPVKIPARLLPGRQVWSTHSRQIL